MLLVFPQVLPLQGLHDFLCHCCQLCREDWFEVAHEGLKERIIKNLFAEIEHIFQCLFSPIDICTRVLACCHPKCFVLQSDYLQNNLYFWCIEPLQLPFKLSYCLFLSNNFLAQFL